MRKRYEAAVAYISELSLKPGQALRESLRAGYTRRAFGADVMAGVTVGIVALPLAMALAIASGVPPQHGIYTAIVAGALIALTGGSKVQVSGPTAAFVVVLAPISATYGLGGLLVATLMAGVILVIMGAARLGRMIEFIPHPVTTGFTAGIAVVIATLQLKDFLGLTLASNPEHYLERVGVLVSAVPTARPGDVVVGAITLATLILWPRMTRRLPAPLVGLTVGALDVTYGDRPGVCGDSGYASNPEIDKNSIVMAFFVAFREATVLAPWNRAAARTLLLAFQERIEHRIAGPVFGDDEDLLDDLAILQQFIGVLSR